MDTIADIIGRMDFKDLHNVPVWQLFAAGFCVYAISTALLHRLWWKTGTVGKEKFPNGMTAYCISGDRFTKLVYKELFVSDAYYQNGVRVPSAENFPTKDGKPPLVLDIGGNVGFFAVSFARKVSSYDVISFEPVPMLCECIEKNIQPYNKDGTQQRIRLVKAGLGDATSRAQFNFDPAVSAGTSTNSAEVWKTASKSGLMQWIAAMTHDNVLIHGPAWNNRLGAWLGSHPILKYPFVPYFMFMMLNAVLSSRLAGNTAVQVDCPIRRLTDALDELEDPKSDRRIALMKIDVEGAEWAVLQGIEDRVWSRVDQTVIEVHNVDGRLDKVMALLKAKGFKHITKGFEEFQSHHLLEIETVFATKVAQQ